MFVKLSTDLVTNLTLRTRDREGRVVEEVSEHNVVIDLGRTYLRDLLSCRSYDLASSDPPPLVPELGATVWIEDRPKFIGLGAGGKLQSAAYPGQGEYTEVVGIRGLERPLPVKYRPGGAWGDPTATWQWMKQVEPQDSAIERPDDFSVIFRAVFAYDEVSFADQIGAYGTVVPISEIMLFTSAADAYYKAPTAVDNYVVYESDNSTVWSWPGGGSSFPGHGGPVPGAMAYNLTTPIYKTSNVTLEVLWELRS